MEVIVIILISLLVASVAFLGFSRLERRSVGEQSRQPLIRVFGLFHHKQASSFFNNASEMSTRFEDLSLLTAAEEEQLVEITDKKLLTRIDSAVPGTLQALANFSTVSNYNKTTKAAGQLYQVVIPKGAVLDKSRALKGAVRGSFRNVPDSIKGNANWIAVDGSTTNRLAAMNVVNSAMSVASMVVGQYYMSQINDQLEGIENEIAKIAEFQDNEYKSKIYALVAEVQKSTSFQIEIIEDNELRNRELAHLRNLEHLCAQLLGQANLTLLSFTDRKDLDYAKYEKIVSEANNWYQYQRILLEVMYKIEDLTYTLCLGAISRQCSRAISLPYTKQTEDTLKELDTWHKGHCSKLGIKVDAANRKRQGVEGIIMNIPALFNDDLHYKAIPKKIADMIIRHSDCTARLKSFDDNDLFQKDVRLIAKGEKLYYLPDGNK